MTSDQRSVKTVVMTNHSLHPTPHTPHPTPSSRLTTYDLQFTTYSRRLGAIAPHLYNR
ncbi:hypothetical protein [Chroococcidiopsis sp.]|uniref:hypothetical protein n=1 Tax=Chroococcidiopsis sp. TaxID=3088168 RepID=UPI003F31C8CE